MSEFLSDLEIFYTPTLPDSYGNIVLQGQEADHAVKVMRKRIGDSLFLTNGNGLLFETIVEQISKSTIRSKVIGRIEKQKQFPHITVVLPILKSDDRLEFALEKSIELGFTKFIICRFSKCSPKSPKGERLERIALAAMKQSLNLFLPEIGFTVFADLPKTPNTQYLVADQNAAVSLNEIQTDFNKNFFLVIGPEGGLTESEKKELSSTTFRLAEGRLRAETAVMAAAAIISGKLKGL